MGVSDGCGVPNEGIPDIGARDHSNDGAGKVMGARNRRECPVVH